MNVTSDKTKKEEQGMKRHRKGTVILSAVLALVVLLGAVGSAVAAESGMKTVDKTPYYPDVNVTLDGEELVLTTEQGQVLEPFLMDGTTYLPVRAVAEAAGLYEDWDEGKTEVKLSTRPITPEPENPVEGQRIICLSPSMVECVYALGLGDSIVGWSAYTDYPEEVKDTAGWEPYAPYETMLDINTELDVEHELAKEVAVVSRFYDYNAEVIDALEPTVILAESEAQRGMYEELTAKGYNTHFYDPKTLEDIYEMMLDIGEVLGARDVAEELVAGYRERVAEIQAITSQLDKPKVYFEIAHQSSYTDETSGTSYTYGPYTNASGTPFDDMIAIAGGENLFADLTGDYTEVTFEDVVERNPDVILSPMWPDAKSHEVTTIYEIMTRPGFETTNAVQNSRVLYYDSSLMKRFGPRTITAIEKLAYLLHPYYFEDPDTGITPWELGRIDQFEPIPDSFR